jgi:hypothetical protein
LRRIEVGIDVGSRSGFQEPRIERRNAGDAVAPGLTYVETFGRTPGHMPLMLASGRDGVRIGQVLSDHRARLHGERA